MGRPSSPEESRAWEAVEKAEGIENQKAASEAFLGKFPDGGMAPYAHYVLASIYRRNNDVASFVAQSEQVLKAIPVFPELSGYLALVYSESGRDSEAEQRALETLKGVDKIGRRTGETEAEWTLRRDQIASDANYALGRVYLGRAVQARGEAARQLLTQSIHRLQQALEYAPHHQYASFRLGEALLKAGKGKEALNWFARTAALGGDLGPIGGKRLAEVGKQLGFSEAELQSLTLEERRRVQEALNQHASNLDKPEKKSPPPSLFRNRPDEKRPD